MKSILSALLFLIVSKVALTEPIRVTDFRSIDRFELGNVVSYNDDKRLEKDDGWIGLKGDIVAGSLAKPYTNYFIRIIPAQKQFFVEIGCLVVKDARTFSPFGFNGDSSRGNASRRSPYYVSETLFGGRKSQAFSYLQIPAKWLPAEAYFDFDDSEQGLRDFRKTLASLLRDFSSTFHLESDSQRALETTIVSDDFNVYLSPRRIDPELARAPRALDVLKRWTSRVNEPQIDSNEVKAQGYLNALIDYSERVLKSNRSEPVILMLERYPMGF
jgi:hypothetical protein